MGKVTCYDGIISDACRNARTDDGAREEAIRKANKAVEDALNGYPSGNGTTIHVQVVVEYQLG